MVIKQFDLMREKLQYFYNDMAREAEEERRYRREAEAIAGTDELTRLFNRRAFFDFLGKRLEELSGNRGVLAVVYLDLNGFKPINDTHGHATGDHVLRVIGRRLIEHTRSGDFAARVGGDEFAVVFTSVANKDAAADAGRRLVAAISREIECDGTEADGCTETTLALRVGVSAGISLYPHHGTTAEQLVECADKAMYGVKRSLGGERSAPTGTSVAVFDPDAV